MIELPSEYFSSLSRYLEDIHFNHLFSRSVIMRNVNGRVYVDNIHHPRTFYIVHRYGMSLLGGDFTNKEFNLAFREHALNTFRNRSEHEWMQVFPDKWNEVLAELLGNRLITAKSNTTGITRSIVELNTRVNFVFDEEAYLKTHTERAEYNPRITIVETTNQIYDKMKGNVVPRSFWNSSKEFIDNGVSFSLYVENNLAATSFSSFIAPGKLELGIETLPAFRGLGFAEKVCAALIDYCLERNLEPLWACRLENTASYILAQKLGFRPSLELPYYRLSN